MTSTEFFDWQAFYELEQEDRKEAVDTAVAKAKAEAGKVTG